MECAPKAPTVDPGSTRFAEYLSTATRTKRSTCAQLVRLERPFADVVARSCAETPILHALRVVLVHHESLEAV